MHLVFLETHSFWPGAIVNDQHVEKLFHFRGCLISTDFFAKPPQVRTLPQNQLSAHHIHKIFLFLILAWLPGPTDNPCLWLGEVLLNFSAHLSSLH